MAHEEKLSVQVGESGAEDGDWHGASTNSDIGSKAEPQRGNLEDREPKEGGNATRERSRGWGANKMEQTQKAPTSNEVSEDDFRSREIAGDDVSETEKIEPNEGHDYEPEHEDGHGGVRAPRGALTEGDENDAGWQRLNDVTKRGAADEADKNDAEDNAHQAGRNTAVSGQSGGQGQLQLSGRRRNLAVDSIDE
jgi:hypothetical protein